MRLLFLTGISELPFSPPIGGTFPAPSCTPGYAIPTFRISYKWFVSDVRAFKVFVGSSYQNYAPFFYLPFMDLYPSPYFRKYPYVYTASFGTYIHPRP